MGGPLIRDLALTRGNAGLVTVAADDAVVGQRSPHVRGTSAKVVAVAARVGTEFTRAADRRRLNMRMRKQLWIVVAFVGCTVANPLYSDESSGGASTGAVTTTGGGLPTTGGLHTTGDLPTTTIGSATTSGDTTTAIAGSTTQDSTTSGDTTIDDTTMSGDTTTASESSGDSSTTQPGFCGDGQIDAGEACDDGANNADTAACKSDCSVQMCGDGFLGPGEGCDDGNMAGGDGCSSGCISEDCGNNIVEGLEVCDDGADGDNDDGCTDLCLLPDCGDGYVQPSLGETCDLAILNNDTDACTTLCKTAACGDGLVHAGVETCDLGANNDDTGACTSACEDAACGDGLVQAGVEACDLGANNSDTGACTAMCEDAVCGDGLVQAGVETCDLGVNNSNVGACTATCKDAVCGDGFVHMGVEGCDSGATNSDLGTCTSGCTVAVCGDGLQSSSEECDDGGKVGGNGCDVNCSSEYEVLPSSNHTCALFATGKVRCWGGGGLLGTNNILTLGDAPGELPTPTLAFGATLLDDLAVSGDSTCAVSQAGNVYCWGYNFEGQLGLGHTNDIGDGAGEVPPTNTKIGDTAASLGGGLGAFCAVTQTGTLRCWGRGEYGRLGIGSVANIGDAPGELPGATTNVGFTVAEVVGSETHMCALSTTGTVRCWGSGADGALGYGNTTSLGDNPGELPTPDVPVGGKVAQLALGTGFSCALMATGNVRCWGKNDDGQLGYESFTSLGDQPGELPTADLELGGSVARISAGYRHACALLQSGAVKCWGGNNAGQLGIGNTQTIGASPGDMPPASVTLGAEAIALHTGGGYHNCAALTNGTVRCWGYNAQGQLGIGSTQHLGDNEAVSSGPIVPIQ